MAVYKKSPPYPPSLEAANLDRLKMFYVPPNFLLIFFHQNHRSTPPKLTQNCNFCFAHFIYIKKIIPPILLKLHGQRFWSKFLLQETLLHSEFCQH
jgi:hypothetical protein